MTVDRELDLLVEGRHHDPHHVLGAHRTIDGSGGTGVVVRALRPAAVRVDVVLDADCTVAATEVRTGVFEAQLSQLPQLTGATLPLRYDVAATYPDGNTTRGRDPYAFLPTVGDLDLHLIGEGRHERLGDVLGAHLRTVDGVDGCRFAVWAPSAISVALLGELNHWHPGAHPMRSLGTSGVWELFVPGVGERMLYKFAVHGADGVVRSKADPVAGAAEVPPRTASVVTEAHHQWRDDAWTAQRAAADPWHEPMSIYEVHAGSWRHGRSYAELGEELGDYVADLGFTHVELLPVMEHPFLGSWGYQVTGFYAPTSRYGPPDEFRGMVDALHRRGIGVILDWVPAHFPRDEWALARFDGTALYEHLDSRRGEHTDWGTLVFNYGRLEVRNFLIASALHWLRDHHADGIRVDAVASMLYLDYSRAEGEWVPNVHGGREDLDAVEFLRELNAVVHREVPGVLSIAEESTAWPGVSRPVHDGGLGFGFKWNMGWMHDTLEYFSRDPIHRRHHHDALTFGLLYAFTENFVLPLSHDEVVHGKGSLLAKMPGDRWQQFANLRALYAHMWAHPGKKLLFMGGELAQPHEWDHDGELPWSLLTDPLHAGVQALVRALNHEYRRTPALHDADFEPAGFAWIEAGDRDHNVLAYARSTRDGHDQLVCVANLSPVPRHGYRVGLPRVGTWHEVLNTDAAMFGGGDVGNGGTVAARPEPWHGQPGSADLTLPPLGVLWLRPEGDGGDDGR